MGYHYVPKEYLRGFSIGESCCLYDKRTRKFSSANISKILQAKGFYPKETEEILTRDIEHPANVALRQLRSEKDIGQLERVALARYIFWMYRRGPLGRERAMKVLPQVAREIEPDLMRRAELISSKFGQERAEAYKNKVSEILARHQAKPDERIYYDTLDPRLGESRSAAAIGKMNWTIIKAPSDHSYITSDFPVIFDESLGLGNPRAELIFPISFKLMLRGTWTAIEPKSFPVATPAQVRRMNLAVTKRATRLVVFPQQEWWMQSFFSRHAV